MGVSMADNGAVGRIDSGEYMELSIVTIEQLVLDWNTISVTMKAVCRVSDESIVTSTSTLSIATVEWFALDFAVDACRWPGYVGT